MFTQLMAAVAAVLFANFHIFQTVFVVLAITAASVEASVAGDDFALPADLLQSSNLTASTLMGNIDINRHWSTDAFIVHQAYPAEVHRVVTEDGYVLTLHRLPQPGHQPVLLVHGLFGSSMDFVIMGRNTSLAFTLWDQHYDVWLANCRGSSFSQQHIQYARDDLAFWNFSFHNIGVFDLPAMMDYIRSNTSFHEMHFVGHSQGATALLITCALRPQYNEYLALVQLMAPLAYFHSIKIEKSYLDIIKGFLKETASREIREFMPRGFLKDFNCFKNKLLQFSCLQLIFQIVGHDLEQVDQSKLELLFHQIPAGGSVKQLRHYFQIYTAGAFQHYNYGYEGNYDKYAAPMPPLYNLTQVSAPIVIHYGRNDHLACAADVKLLYDQLTNGQGMQLVEHALFNHLDFIWSKQLHTLLNQKIIQNFNKLRKSMLLK